MKPAHLGSLLIALSGVALTACNDEPLAADPAGPETGGFDATGGAGATPAGGAGEAPVLGRCGTPDPELSDADAADLFDYPHVPAFDLYLPPEEWERLQVTATEEQYVEAEACFEGRGVGRVGLRFKGSYGSLYECADSVGQGTCRKLSMKVKFDEYAADQRFFGLKRLNFNANRHDDSRIKERLAYDTFRAMGIVTPRAAWAVLRINDESQGLYGMVEEVDGRFTADRWPETPDNNLYKEAWPTVTTADQITSLLKTNEETADVSGFLAFADAMVSAADPELRSTLGTYTDLDYFARFLAVEDAVASYDGITYFWTDGTDTANHNYYLFEQAPDDFIIIPWDVESTFWINPDHTTPHWTVPPGDCSLTYEYWGGLARAPGCDRVMQALAADLGPWRAACQELLDGPFAEASMLAAIDHWSEYVRAEAMADPTPSSYSDFDSAVADLRRVIPLLRARLEQLMAGP